MSTSDKVPGVFFPQITFGSSGFSENGNGIGDISIDGVLASGARIDLISLNFQNMPIRTYNDLDRKANAGDWEAIRERSNCTRRVSKKQADWIAKQLIASLNKIVAEGIPHDDDLPV